MLSELDFVKEWSNTDTVRKNLIKGGLISDKDEAETGGAVRIPKVIVEAVTITDSKQRGYNERYAVAPSKEVLVLEFINGVKPTDEDALSRIGLMKDNIKAREDVVARISRAFAQQIFVDGIFSGDPHPGNILVEKIVHHNVLEDVPDEVEFRPVLLDFGLTKHVPNLWLRLAFCRLVVAAHEQDISGLLAAMRDMGFGKQVSLWRPEMALQWIQYAFRESRPEEDFKEQLKRKPQGGEGKEARAKREKEEMEMEFEEAVSDEDNDAIDEDYFGGPSGTDGKPNTGKKLPRYGTVEWLWSSGKIDVDEPGDEAFEDANEEKEDMDAMADGKKVKDFEGLSTIFFLLRVVGLLRGLWVRLGVRHSYLDTMAPLAKEALRKGYAELQLQEHKFNPPKRLESPSEKAFLILAFKLMQEKQLLGGAVCAFKDNRMLLEVPLGECGVADPRPVANDTLFNSFSCSKILPVLLIHIFTDKGFIESLDDPVCKYWPEFWKNGKKNITVRMALEHRAGLANAFPSKLSMLASVVASKLTSGKATGPGAAIRGICNFPKMVRWVATAKPNTDQLGKTHYHAVSHGWVLGGLCEAVVKNGWAKEDFPGVAGSYPELVKRFITKPLDIESEIRTTVDKPEDEKRVASLALHSDHLDRTGGDLFSGFTARLKATSVEGMKEQNDAVSKLVEEHDQAKSSDGDSSTTASEKTTPWVSKEKASAEQKKKDTEARRAAIATIGLDPRIFNDPTVRAGLLPAANTHFTVRGLATIFASFLKTSQKKVLSDKYLDNVIYKECLPVALDKARVDKAFPLGIRVMRNAKEQPLLGAPGLINDIGYVDVTNGFACAVLVNQLDTEAKATDALLAEAARTCSNDKNTPIPALPWRREQRII